MNKANRPVIIIGMHRSGTTMIAEMLNELGLFIGWDLEINNEARFFYQRNEMILNSCGGSWDNPSVIDNLLNHSYMKEVVIAYLQKDLQSPLIFSYLGPQNFVKYRSLERINFSWGWKDPRNTFLLPLWINIFPGAKIIHVYRNGIDVAHSLAMREMKHIQTLLKSSKDAGLLENQVGQIKENGFLLYSIGKIQRLCGKIDTLEKYKELGIHSCISIEKGFDLWCTYIEKAFEYIGKIKNEVINIKYEEFLLEPEDFLIRLQEFCELPFNGKDIKSIAKIVNPTRKNAFSSNETLMNFYNKNKDNYWMTKLNYNLKP